MRDYKVMLRELEPASSTRPPRGPLALSNDNSLMPRAAHDGVRAAIAENNGGHNAGPGDNLPAAVKDVVNSPGQALDNESRCLMEPRFGHDFSKVRVHTGDRAAESARALGALAYTLGPNIVFGAGRYEPSSSQGRQLLAHELTHVVQQSGGGRSFTARAVGINSAPVSLALQRHLGHGTNYRFDTHQVTGADLSDADIIERFNSMSIDGLRAYMRLTTDGDVLMYIEKVITAKSLEKSKAAAQVDRADYLSKVHDAVQASKVAALADKTLSGMLFPLLEQLADAKHVIWRDAAGAETVGKTVAFKPSGKGAKTMNITLVLDEADPDKEKRNGYFDASAGRIVLFVRNRPAVDGIRETLYHEGTHMTAHIIESQGEAAIGGKAATAAKSFEGLLNKTAEIETLKGSLERLRLSINSSRGRRAEPRLEPAMAESTAKFLWEEIAVRAETFFFEVLRYESAEGGEKPQPNYLNKESLKSTYLKAAGFLTDSDLAGLTADDDTAIGLISQFLLYRMRSLIMARGVRREYVPHPLEPKEIDIRIAPTIPDPGPIIKLEDLKPDFLKKIPPGPNQPPF
jgi:hypothetical protein